MKQEKARLQALPRDGDTTDEGRPVHPVRPADLEIKEPGGRELAGTFFLFLAVSLVAMFFCCVHSPFFRFSVYQDANIFMAVGQAMRHGLMPYRDVFDHKGILLYLINLLAATMFPTSMTGVYLILSVSLAVFLFFGYRIARLFLPAAPSLIAAFLLFCFSIGNTVYSDGGGSAEEYFMPCLAGCLFFLIRSYRYAGNRPGESARRFFTGSVAVGVLCGVMLWMKYTMLFAVGVSFLFLYGFLFVKKRVKDVALSLIGVFLGLLAISVPCVLYLASQGLLEDMWSVYVLFNIRYGSGGWLDSETAVNIGNYFTALLSILCSLLGLFFIRIKTKVLSRAGAWGVFVLIASVWLTITAIGRFYMYYFLVLVPFVIFATISVVLFIYLRIERGRPDRFGRKARIFATVIMIVLILVETIAMSSIQWRLGAFFSPKKDLEYCADVINEHWTQNGDGKPPRILSFLVGEKGLMQLCDTYPQTKYFYMPNVIEEQGMRIAREQIGYIKEERVDYVFIYGGGDVLRFMRQTNPAYRPILVRGGHDGDPEKFFYVFALVGTGENGS